MLTNNENHFATLDDEFLSLLHWMFSPSELPSKDNSKAWHYANNPNEKFRSSEKSGKWCIFSDRDDIDAAWAKIKAATEEGRFLLAKVSTSFSSWKRPYVICVYTRDWSDLGELMAAREVLRELGFTRLLGYKRDLDTRNKVYGANEWYLNA